MTTFNDHEKSNIDVHGNDEDERDFNVTSYNFL